MLLGVVALVDTVDIFQTSRERMHLAQWRSEVYLTGMFEEILFLQRIEVREHEGHAVECAIGGRSLTAHGRIVVSVGNSQVLSLAIEHVLVVSSDIV